MAGLKTTSPGILIAPTQRTGRLRRSRLATSRRHNWIRALHLACQRHSPGRRAIRHPHNQTRLGSPQTNQAQGLPNRPIPRCLHQLQHCQCHLQCCLHQCCPLEPCCRHQHCLVQLCRLQRPLPGLKYRLQRYLLCCHSSSVVSSATSFSSVVYSDLCSPPLRPCACLGTPAAAARGPCKALPAAAERGRPAGCRDPARRRHLWYLYPA